jgi:hypothetical protein
VSLLVKSAFSVIKENHRKYLETRLSDVPCIPFRQEAMVLVTIWSYNLQFLFKELLPVNWNLLIYQMVSDEKILLLYHFYYKGWHFNFTHFFIVHLQLKGLLYVWQFLYEFKICPVISLYILYLNQCQFFYFSEIPIVVTAAFLRFLLVNFFMDGVNKKENEHVLSNHKFRILVRQQACF